MAPITCKVISSSGVQVEGMNVVLSCKDQCLNTFTEFESFTDDTGSIHFWFPFPSAGRCEIIEPEQVDNASYPRFTMAFFPRPSLDKPLPWVSIQADLYLPSDRQHEIVLRLGTDFYTLEHIAQPVCGDPVISDVAMSDLILCAGTSTEVTEVAVVPATLASQRSPSPLMLPSPITPDCGAIAKRRRPAKRGRKRKAPSGDRNTRPAKKRKLRHSSDVETIED